MSFLAKNHIFNDETYTILQCDYAFDQPMDIIGKTFR